MWLTRYPLSFTLSVAVILHSATCVSPTKNMTVIYTSGDCNMVTRQGHYELARATFDVQSGRLLDVVNMTDVTTTPTCRLLQ